MTDTTQWRVNWREKAGTNSPVEFGGAWIIDGIVARNEFAAELKAAGLKVLWEPHVAKVLEHTGP